MINILHFIFSGLVPRPLDQRMQRNFLSARVTVIVTEHYKYSAGHEQNKSDSLVYNCGNDDTYSTESTRRKCL